MSLYSCSSCTDTIPQNKPRLHCTVCRSHDVCANCYVLSTYTGSHTEDHVSTLCEQSGTIAPPIPPRPPLPVRPSSTMAPKVIPQQPAQLVTRPVSEVQNFARPQRWTPLFDGCNPSGTGLAFFNAVFDCLDTEKRGLLTPERYSAFNDVQGYLPDEDVWKRTNSKAQFGYNSEDLADYEFRTILENFSFEFSLQPRSNITPNDDMSKLVDSMAGAMGKNFADLMKKNITPTPLSGGSMPMLTRKGFIDITTVETLGDPSLGWQRINRMARHYNIWREWGDCPREMLPEEAPKALLDRIVRVTEYSRRQAAERTEAKRVQLALEQQGRENALSLLDPPGTRYYRY